MRPLVSFDCTFHMDSKNDMIIHRASSLQPVTSASWLPWKMSKQSGHDSSSAALSPYCHPSVKYTVLSSLFDSGTTSNDTHSPWNTAWLLPLPLLSLPPMRRLPHGPPNSSLLELQIKWACATHLLWFLYLCLWLLIAYSMHFAQCKHIFWLSHTSKNSNWYIMLNSDIHSFHLLLEIVEVERILHHNMLCCDR